LYEGTRVTPDVKMPPRTSVMGRTWRAFSWLSLAALLALLGLLASAGCSSDSDCKGPTCHACRDRGCADGQRCVQNECRNACSSDAECLGVQVCRGYEFQLGDQGQYCVVLPGSDPSTGNGRFSACTAASECDQTHGFDCVDGECSYECRSHSDCKVIGHCEERAIDDQRRNFCVADAAPPAPGTLYTSCPRGDECAEGYLCVGAGVGDLDAYCTTDCTSDDSCAQGYFCGTITHPPCEAACNLKAQPSDPSCVPSAQIGPRALYQCTELGLVRNVCRQREFCSQCDSDADCLAIPNQVCAKDESGEKICTRLCDTDTRSCPWGNASRCAVFDRELGLPTCSHRFGACHGSGKTCEPCRANADCPNGVCASSQFTGERWCINFDTKCSCPQADVDNTGTCSNGGCPKAPSGLPVLCIGDESLSLFNTCYAANGAGSTQLGASPQTGCWSPQ
jgi:hypothetical protein